MPNVSFKNSKENRKDWEGGDLPFLDRTFQLVIYQLEDKKVIYSTVVNRRDLIKFWYIHSSDQTPVEQVFSITSEGYLNLLEESYSWYGAGLEFGSGFEISFEGDRVIVRGYDRILEHLLLRIARTVPQVLTVGDKELILTDLLPGGTTVLIKLEKLSGLSH